MSDETIRGDLVSTPTHQERAERAAKAVHEDLHYLGAKDAHADIIAREMFPRELVEAARCTSFNAELSPDPRMGGATDVYLVPTDDIEALRLALALYPEPEEETEHER